MSKYIALENIGGYKKGEVVPTDKAVIWEKAYKVSPVKEVEEEVKEEKQDEIVEEKPKTVVKKKRNKKKRSK